MRKLRHYLLFAFLVLLPACPTTCICTPMNQDHLTRGTSVNVSGYYFSSEGLVANTPLECRLTYYRASFEDFENLGTVTSNCTRETNALGGFNLNLDLLAPGLYELQFVRSATFVGDGEFFMPREIEFVLEMIPSGESESGVPQTITRIPNVPAQEDQYFFLDWNSDPDEALAANEALKRFFTETMPGITGDQAHGLAQQCKTRISEIVEEHYDGVRVYASSTSRYDAQTITMYGCSGWEDWCIEGSAFAACGAMDFGNEMGPNWPECGVYLPKMMHQIFEYYEEIGLTEQWRPKNYLIDRAVSMESSDERVEDCARFIGKTVAHELGHSLGLVSDEHLFGSVGGGVASRGHNPMNTRYPEIIYPARTPRFGIMSVNFTPSEYQYFEHCEHYNDSEEEVERCPHFFSPFNWQYLRAIQ